MFQRAVYTGVALCAAMLIGGQALKSQAPAIQQWEAASVTATDEYGEQQTAGGPTTWHGGAVTCIATPKGCQGQKITAEGGIRSALMQAASTLGEQGWELVGVTDLTPGQKGGLTMYFRRPKVTR